MLESESIEIFREAVAGARNAVLMYQCQGKIARVVVGDSPD